MCEITKKKNSDYTGDDSKPFKNFTMVETIGFASTEQGFLTRIIDKVMRVAGFIKNGTLHVVDEKVTDTLLDCANYCILMICYLESKHETKQ
jgi:anti-sigma28 factor (negative regulator of flagellin synthesis)